MSTDLLTPPVTRAHRVTAAARPQPWWLLGAVRERLRGPAWPLLLLCYGFPLWWLLGLGALLPLAAALVLLAQLDRARLIYLPPGFAAWALFLVWVSLGVFVLWADAPDAVPGGGGPNRLGVFAYRLAWYAACTVVLVWVINSDPRRVTWRALTNALGFMFIVTALGGLLGVVAPNLDFPSVFEAILPRGLAKNSFVQSLIHPSVADIQMVLKRPEPRPTAPFAFANSWGANLSMFLPFFVVSWVLEGRRWQRLLAGPVVVVALVPTVYSLNRGLWVSLGVGAAVAVVWILRQAPAARWFGGLAGLTAIVGFVASPLSGLILERLANQHSNDRRGQLLAQTVDSTLNGSPIIGFGSTRDVQGSFASIAGASTPDCPACGVPPLGTQGHLWLVIFSQGFVGVALFAALFGSIVLLIWRCRTRAAALGMVLLTFFVIQVSVYDTLGMPLFTLMVGLGLAVRDYLQGGPGASATLPVWRSFRRRLSRSKRVLVAGLAIGASFGVGLALQAPSIYDARVTILLDPSPLSLVDLDAGSTSSFASTVDTEAALVFATAASIPLNDPLRVQDEQIRVTATPNTRALHIDVRDTSAEAAAAKVERLAEGYLGVRRDYLLNRRNVLVSALRQQITDFDAGRGGELLASADQGGETRERFRKRVEQIIADILVTPTNAGDVIARAPAALTRSQREVPVTAGGAVGLGLAYLWALFGRARRSEPELD